MSGIEYTQTFSYTSGATGLTGLRYFPLNASNPSAGSAYIIKSFFVSSSNGLSSSLSGTIAPAVTCVTCDDASGTNIKVFASFNPGANLTGRQYYNALNALAQPSTDPTNYTCGGTQIISRQPYVGVNVNFAAGGGTFSVVVTYLVIDGTNPLAAYFGVNQSLGGASGSGINSPINSSDTSTRLVKSIMFSNFFNTGYTYTIQMVSLGSSGTTIAGYLPFTYVLAPYQCACFYAPYYIYANSTEFPGFVVTSSSPGLGAVNYYMSYMGAS